MRFLKEPLFHFLLFGAAIFAWYAWLNPPDPEARTAGMIVVDNQDVDRLAQQFEAVWRRPPTEKELQGLVDGMVREEVLVREATALGLDRGDGVIRNRLRQKMEFLTTSVAQAMEPSDDALQDHLDRNPDRFTRPGAVAFEQVSLDDDADSERVERDLQALTEGADPADFGARSLLPRSIPLTRAEAVDATFGRGFFDALAVLPESAWSGPVASGYGAHLVRVTERVPPILPPLSQIRDAVLLDWRREKANELTEAQFEALRAQYEIALPDLPTGGGVE